MLLPSEHSSEARVKPAAVAGTFYSADPVELARSVDGMLAGVPLTSRTRPKALVVPHAGHAYSGPIAAHAYALLRPYASEIRRVVMVGPAHRAYIRGLALPDATALATPLGVVPIDRAGVRTARQFPAVVVDARVHAAEHCLEVQLPFLQRVLDRFEVVPLVVGEVEPQQVAAVLEALWGGDETLIVVSTDLSHYHPYGEARALDAETVAHIAALAREPIDHDHACGATPLNGFLLAARAHGLQPRILDVRNSGDTAGPRDGVVGYAALAFAPHADESTLTDARKALLLALARSAITAAIGADVPAPPREGAWLDAPGACFVTLKVDGELHGCIGTLEARRSLGEDVRANAVAAALDDPRFPALRPDELARTRIEISLLSPLSRIEVANEAAALAAVRPGEDGLLIRYGARRGTLLPQMWDEIPDRAEFFHHLKRKAGLPAGFWADDVELYRYTVTHFEEGDAA